MESSARRAFVMRVSDDEMEDDIESKDGEVHDRSLVAVRRFNCDALYLRYVYFISHACAPVIY